MEPQVRRQVQLEDVIEIIFHRKWFIIIPFILSIVGTLLALTLILPVYKSTTLILVEPQKVPEAYVKPTITVVYAVLGLPVLVSVPRIRTGTH